MLQVRNAMLPTMMHSLYNRAITVIPSASSCEGFKASLSSYCVRFLEGELHISFTFYLQDKSICP